MAVDAALTLEELERLLPPEMFREMGFGGGRNTQQKAAAAAALRRLRAGGPPRDLEHVEDIGYQLASFGLRGRSFSSIFHTRPSLTPPLNVSPRSEMANRTVVRLSPPEMGIRYREAPPPRGTGAYIPFPKPFHPVQTPVQMSGYGMGRGGGAVHRLPPPPAAAARFVGPVRSGLITGRESGTGVFLPRVAFVVDSARKTGGPNVRREQQKQPGTDVRRQQGAAGMRTPETPELGLPHEWTY